MSILIQLIIALLILGLVVYFIETLIPIPIVFKRLIYAVAILIVILWLLQLFGIFTIPRRTTIGSAYSSAMGL